MKFITLLAAAAVMTTPVLAADAIVYNEPAPIAAPDTFSWTGGYIGVNAGYAWGKIPTHLDWYEDGEIYEAYDYKQNLNGFIGGVQAGYNWQYDQMVLGVETDIQGTSLKKRTSTSASGEFDTTFFDLESKINWLGTTRVRVGYLPSERLMAYITGGVAYGGVKASLTDYFGDNFSKSKTKIGYTLGAGLEYAFADNWTVKGEYLYADLGKLSQTVYDANDYLDIAKHKFRLHTVRFGVNYKF